MKEFDKDSIVESLKTTICMVVFNKKDGERREMKCTLNQSMIPTLEIDETRVKRTRAENPDILPVYDVEAKGWRSFRWDSLIDFRDSMNL